ncbi:predicted protein, partial [Nematostella vectensis]
LPLLWSLFAGVMLAVCYTIATSKGHVYPYVPAISDTGLFYPESSIFSESFNFIAYSVLVLMMIRYFQVRQILASGTVQDGKEGILTKLNKASLVVGTLSAFGATLVGNFKSERKHTTMMFFHDAGSILLFAAGSCYFWIHVVLTHHLVKIGYNSCCMFAIRFALTVLCSVCGLTFFLAEIYGYRAFLASGSTHTIQQWKPGDAGYELHVVSNVAEWVAGASFTIYISTFYSEFQRLSL